MVYGICLPHVSHIRPKVGAWVLVPSSSGLGQTGDNKQMVFMRCSMQSANKDRVQPPREAVEGKLDPPEGGPKRA